MIAISKEQDIIDEIWVELALEDPANGAAKIVQDQRPREGLGTTCDFFLASQTMVNHESRKAIERAIQVAVVGLTNAPCRFRC